MMNGLELIKVGENGQLEFNFESLLMNFSQDVIDHIKNVIMRNSDRYEVQLIKVRVEAPDKSSTCSRLTFHIKFKYHSGFTTETVYYFEQYVGNKEYHYRSYGKETMLNLLAFMEVDVNNG